MGLLRSLDYRKPTDDDIGLLAEMNRQLIEDEGHGSAMNLAQLERRMRGWLQNEYHGLIFEEAGLPVAYVLWRLDTDSVYLRQFFVARGFRRRGVGRRAITLLRERFWPRDRRVMVEVLCRNQAGHAFWRALGFSDYSIAMEMRP